MASVSLINSNLVSDKRTDSSLQWAIVNKPVTTQSRKWTYLISNNIQFSHNIEHAMTLKKPDADQMFDWIEKLICGHQCKSIFVEQLDTHDSRFQHITFLCKVYKVALVSLSAKKSFSQNVVMGPWIKD